MMSEGLAECEWIRGVLESAVHRDYDRCNFPPTVTVIKADSAIHLDPSIVCIVDAKGACDHLIRSSTGGHRRRTAEELCLFRQSICNPCVPNVAGCPTA